MMDKANIANLYRLSPLQGGMLFHALYDEAGSHYFEQGVYRLDGEIDVDLFERAWGLVVDRHDALRTAFLYRDVPEPIQVVLRKRPIDFDREDIRSAGVEEQEEIIARYRSRVKKGGFDLGKDPLLRIGVFRIADGAHVMVMSFHHIIMDGWCQSILASDLVTIYSALLRGETPILPPARQYREYVRWLDMRAKEGAREEGLAFWESYLHSLSEPTWFPVREQLDNGLEQVVAQFRLDRAATRSLSDRVRTSGWTLNAVVQGLIGLLLGRLNGTNDAVFLGTVSGRPEDLPGAGEIVGLFINALPVRVRASRDLALAELFVALQRDAGEAQPWQFAPLAEIQGRTGLGSRLSNTLLVIENYPMPTEGEDLPFRFSQIEIDEKTNYDLTIQVHPGTELGFSLAFPSERIDPQTVAIAKEWLRTSLERVAGTPDLTVGELFDDSPIPWTPGGRSRIESSSLEKLRLSPRGMINARLISTFTAEPITPWLSWWLEQMGYELTLTHADFNQVFQELLNPESGLNTQSGIGILLVRFDDWLSERGAESSSAVIDHLDRVYGEYIAALDQVQGDEGVLHVLLPADRSLLAPSVRDRLEALEHQFIAEAAKRPGFGLIDARSLAEDYLIADPFDRVSFEAGAIPYSRGMNSAIGTVVARRLLSRTHQPVKVIVVDCDNTLWRGIAGEDGPEGVRVDGQFRRLQSFLIDRFREGFLIALCSKNNPEDVDQVFSLNDGMILRPDHIVDRRVNWRPKSENLRELAEDLNLGLDSLMFLDDSPIEIAEVRENLPEVLALQFPSDPEAADHLLRHLWGLDKWSVTDEDRRRSQMYVAEKKRRESETVSTSLDEFLSGLDIRITMAPLADHEIPRASQLTQRTNQFNVSTVRRSEVEMKEIIDDPSMRCWRISVEDRFGSYGIVGLVIGCRKDSRLVVDTLLLSCRVLGRGVESAILSGLRRWGLKHGLSQMEIPFVPTPRNAPALQFLESLRVESKPLEGTPSGLLFVRELSDLPTEPVTGTLKYLLEPSPSAEVLGDRATEVESGLPEDRVPAEPGRTGAESASVARPRSDRFRSVQPADLETPYGLLHGNRMLPVLLSDEESLLQLPVGGKDGIVVPPESDIPFVRPVTPDEVLVTELFAEVLGTGPVGMGDDFFALGGNSLTAVELLSKLHRAFGAGVSLPMIFEAPRPDELLDAIRGAGEREFEPITRVPDQEHYPLSFAQQRLWLLDDLGLAGTSYLMGGASRVVGELDVEALQNAFGQVISRHESLRTAIVEIDGTPRQKVVDNIDFSVEVIDLGRLTLSEPERSLLLQRLIRERTTSPFDLSNPPLLRATIIRVEPEESILVVVLHHIVADGWSYPILVHELLTFYRTYAHGGSTPEPGDGILPPPGVQYRDYAVWQLRHAELGAWGASEEFWKSSLAWPRPELDLPTDRPRTDTPSTSGGSVLFGLSADLVAGIDATCRRERTTRFMVLLAAVRFLLWRITGSRETIIGVPVAGREHPDLERQIGFFVNTLPLRQRIDPVATVSETLQATREHVLEGFSHQELPFDRILGVLDEVDRSTSRNPLFDVMVAMQNNRPADLEVEGLHLEPFGEEAGAGKFDLVFNFDDTGDGLACSLEYRTDLFDRERIEGWGEALCDSIRDLTGRHDLAPATGLELLARVKQEIATVSEAPRPIGSVERNFRAIAGTQPDATAIVDPYGELSYGQLERRGRAFASLLRDRGVEKGNIVAVVLPAGRDQIIAMLGILKLGAVYLPIDAEYPAARIVGTVTESGAYAVVVQPEASVEGFNVLDVVEFTDASTDDPVTLHADENHTLHTSIEEPIDGADPIYVIYTSGSTGSPKGVLVEDGPFLNMITAQIDSFGIVPSDRVLQFASPAFDASLSEAFMALLAGATLVFPERRVLRDPESFTEFLRQESLTVATIPPVYLRAIGNRSLAPLRVLISAGEAAPPEQILYHASLREYAVFNAYGPTESAVCATIYRVDPDNVPTNTIPVGHPISGVGAIVTDADLFPVPDGVEGELVLYGAGLARGYLDDQRKTDERFVFPDWNPELRCYRTGDRVRLLAGTGFEFVGRNDGQVKVRGHRVEPEEVRQAFLRLLGVRDAVVVIRPPSGTESPAGQGGDLVAFVIPESPENGIDPDGLRGQLASRLPAYLVPSTISQVNEIPVTVNGKVDVGRLLAELPPISDSSEVGAETDETERALLGVVSEVLGCGPVDPGRSFFALGGDSLGVIRLNSVLRDRGYEIDVRDVYNRPDLRSLARTLKSAHEPVLGRDRTEFTGSLPLTPIQKWVLQTAPTGSLPDLSLSLVAEVASPLDRRILAEAIHRLGGLHDALRTTAFLSNEGTLELEVLGETGPPEIESVIVEKFKGEIEAEVSSEFSHVLNRLESGFPFDGRSLLFRTAVVEDRAGAEMFLLTIHHLVVDAFSIDRILGDLDRIYRALLKGDEPDVAAPATSMGEWAHHLAGSGFEVSAELLEYYRSMTSKVDPGMFRIGAGVNAEEDSTTESILLACGRELTERVKALGAGRYGVNVVLLTALRRALSSVVEANRDLPVLVEGHGRFVDGVYDLGDTVGWMTTLNPILLPGADDVSSGLNRTRARLDALSGEELAYLQLVTDPRYADQVGDLRPGITFNYLGEIPSSAVDRMGREESFFSYTGLNSTEGVRRLNDVELNALIEEGEIRILVAFAGYVPDDIRRSIGEQLIPSISEIVDAAEPAEPVSARVIALPSAGGILGEYDSLRSWIPETVELVAPELSGHGRRINEEPSTRFGEMVVDIVEQIRGKLDRPYVLFGHSLGGLLLREVVLALREEGLSLPRALVPSAMVAPSRFEATTGSRVDPDEGMMRGVFTEVARGVENLPEDFVERSIMGTKADLAAVAGYEYHPSEKLALPLTLLYGLQDDIGVADIMEWSRETTGEVTMRAIEGGHTFIAEHSARVAEVLLEALVGETLDTSAARNGERINGTTQEEIRKKFEEMIVNGVEERSRHDMREVAEEA